MSAVSCSTNVYIAVTMSAAIVVPQMYISIIVTKSVAIAVPLVCYRCHSVSCHRCSTNEYIIVTKSAGITIPLVCIWAGAYRCHNVSCHCCSTNVYIAMPVTIVVHLCETLNMFTILWCHCTVYEKDFVALESAVVHTCSCFNTTFHGDVTVMTYKFIAQRTNEKILYICTRLIRQIRLFTTYTLLFV